MTRHLPHIHAESSARADSRKRARPAHRPGPPSSPAAIPRPTSSA
jgi:hypothetical protein